jgi:hypothetical protein
LFHNEIPASITFIRHQNQRYDLRLCILKPFCTSPQFVCIAFHYQEWKGMFRPKKKAQIFQTLYLRMVLENYLWRTAKGCEQSDEVAFPGTFLTLQAEGEENHETPCLCSGRGSNRVPLERKSYVTTFHTISEREFSFRGTD